MMLPIAPSADPSPLQGKAFHPARSEGVKPAPGTVPVPSHASPLLTSTMRSFSGSSVRTLFRAAMHSSLNISQYCCESSSEKVERMASPFAFMMMTPSTPRWLCSRLRVSSTSDAWKAEERAKSR